jgi:hypothetical protein
VIRASSLVPFRWPAEWKDPTALALLKGTPVNCLAGSTPPPFPVGDLPFVTLDAAKPPEGISLSDGAWPRVLPAKEDDTSAAGVTGGAWVDSNAGAIRLAQAKEPAKQVWLTYPPPPKEVIPFEEYVRPVAEASAYGARWVIALDAAFAQAIGSANTRALGVWRQMMAVLKLFTSRSEWQTWQPVANLAVVSSFQGDMQLVAEEFLALAPRRHLAHRVVLASDFAWTTFEKQKAIIYLDALPSAGDTRTALLRFAENGGTVLAPRGLVGQASGLSSPPVTKYDHNIHTVGRGRVITPIDTWEDPFTLVRQVQLLLSIREDVVQVWNGGDMNSHYLSSPDGRQAIVHLIPYASGNTQPVTIGVRQRYRAARVTTSAAAAPVATTPVTITAGGLGFEIPVGEFSCFAAVELDI